MVKTLVLGFGVTVRLYLDFSLHDSQQVEQFLLRQIGQRRLLPVGRFLSSLGRLPVLLLSLDFWLPVSDLRCLLLVLLDESRGGLDASLVWTLHTAALGSHFLPVRREDMKIVFYFFLQKSSQLSAGLQILGFAFHDVC